MLRNILLACLGLTLCSSSPLVAEELIEWHEDVAAARQLSQQYKVPMLVHFYGDQCMPCKTLEKNVFSKPEVAGTMQRYFVPVRINATQDRRTAAEYGVHSWPTDVFISPDGKTLTQGVCNQNANSYLQNLQNVAIMNRDRNIMLAAGGPSGATASTADASAYGRTAAANLQQAAPGREPAPSPYSNPASGPAPYATQSPPSGLAAAGQSSLPSPAWQGQSTHGQATNGQLGAGPLPVHSMTVHPSAPAMNQDNKDANLPPVVQLQTASANPAAGNPHFAQSQLGAQSQPGAQSHASVVTPQLPAGMPSFAAPQQSSPALATAPTLPQATSLPTGGQPFAAATALPSARPTVGQANGSVVDNPHYVSQPATQGPHTPANMPGAFVPGNFPGYQLPGDQFAANPPQMTGAVPANQTLPHQPVAYPNQSTLNQSVSNQRQPSMMQSEAAAPRLTGQLVSSNGKLPSAAPATAPQSTASVPALGGYCPVALFTNSQWVEGSPDLAIRHRGRIYFLGSEETAKKFLEAPDSYCPTLSGYDPLVFLKEGRFDEGSIYNGVLTDRQHILLFSSAANKKYFFENYDRLVLELDTILLQGKPLTAATPAPGLTR